MNKSSSKYQEVTFDCSLLMMDKRQSKLDVFRCVSLGVGNFPENAPIMFVPSPAATECSSGMNSSENSSLLEPEDEKCPSPLAIAVEQLIQVERGLESMVERSVDFFIEKASNMRHMKKKTALNDNNSVQEETGPFIYMRVSDLDLAVDLCTTGPNVAVKEMDARWVQLGVGSDSVQPTVEALAEAGLMAISNETLWKADKKTERVIQGRNYTTSCRTHPQILDYEGTSKDTDVLIWSGKFSHCGHDIPVYRSSGIIAMDADELIHLLLDSSRIHEYNKVSEGRTDEIIYTNDLCASEGITKVVRSKSKPPIVSKSLEFTSLMHARRLTAADGHGKGYILVTRGVTLRNEKSDQYSPEILLNVSLIKEIDGLSKKCEMINMNYVSMPIIPSFLVKKLGYNGAISFFNDLRSLCD
jgi:hypothetical protein